VTERRWGGAAPDDEFNKVRDLRSGRRDVDLHVGADELASGLVGILTLVLLNPA
jgi:hypothetical protein